MPVRRLVSGQSLFGSHFVTVRNYRQPQPWRCSWLTAAAAAAAPCCDGWAGVGNTVMVLSGLVQAACLDWPLLAAPRSAPRAAGVVVVSVVAGALRSERGDDGGGSSTVGAQVKIRCLYSS